MMSLAIFDWKIFVYLKDCGATHDTRYAAEYHYKICSKSPFKVTFKCRKCDKIYPHVTSVKYHLETQHTWVSSFEYTVDISVIKLYNLSFKKLFIPDWKTAWW